MLTDSTALQERDAKDILKPWATPELRAEIEKKHQMDDHSRVTGDKEDFEAYRQQRIKVTAMVRAAKLEYIGLQEEQVRGGSRESEQGACTAGRRWLDGSRHKACEKREISR